MFPRHQFLILALGFLAAASGCRTHQALKRSTVHQAETVMDIQQKQVLDNLAKFVHDPYAVPSFALATQGVSGVTDSGRANMTIGWVANGFNAVGLGADGNRAVNGNWTMTPITDPRKLELMRCAYQRVLANCGVAESTCCPDCKKRFNKFYTGRSYGTKLTADGKTCYECDENGELKNLVSQACDSLCVCQDCACEEVIVVNPSADNCQPEEPTSNNVSNSSSHSASGAQPEVIQTPDQKIICFNGNCKDCPSPSSGIVTSECLYPDCCWFRKSCNKKDIPKRCQLVGHYCGTYVWVPCGPGRDKLAQLTLAILDYATNEDAQLPTKKVVAYMKRDGSEATEETAQMVITTEIGVDEPSASVVSVDLDILSVELGIRGKKKACLERCNKIIREYNNEKGKEIGTIRDFGDMKKWLDSDAQEILSENGSDETKRKIDKLNINVLELENAQHNRIRALPPIRPMPQRRTPIPGAGLLLQQQRLNTVQ